MRVLAGDDVDPYFNQMVACIFWLALFLNFTKRLHLKVEEALAESDRRAEDYEARETALKVHLADALCSNACPHVLFAGHREPGAGHDQTVGIGALRSAPVRCLCYILGFIHICVVYSGRESVRELRRANILSNKKLGE